MVRAGWHLDAALQACGQFAPSASVGRSVGAGLKPPCYRVCAVRSLPPGPLLSAGRSAVRDGLRRALICRRTVAPSRPLFNWCFTSVSESVRRDMRPDGGRLRRLRWRGSTSAGRRHCISSARKSLSATRARAVAPIELNYSPRRRRRRRRPCLTCNAGAAVRSIVVKLAAAVGCCAPHVCKIYAGNCGSVAGRQTHVGQAAGRQASRRPADRRSTRLRSAFVASVAALNLLGY